MFTSQEKPKRHPKKKQFIRLFLIALIAIPALFFVLNPSVETSLLKDGIALSVMICSAVYILHQGFVWLIATYLGISEEIEE